MTFRLNEVLAPTDQLTWVVGRVSAIDVAGKSVEIALGSDGPNPAPRIPGAAYLASYTPRLGDKVHALRHPQIGVLVLGTTTR
jgi:hypothetical protein